jgi:precorrin-8X/cobalt-precorrin-8 methylmutase
VRPFERFVVVDWSARQTPAHGADSIWIAVAGDREECVNVGTRAAATSAVRWMLSDAVARRVRTLVGWDFPLGYPAGAGAALGHPDWRGLWRDLARVSDDERNGNDRFALAAGLNRRLTGGAAPFWGCPPSAAGGWLTTGRTGFTFPVRTSSGHLLEELRRTERRARAGAVGPKSVWQLLGRGSVGSQAILGIPRVLQLLEDPVLARSSDVWPLTTGFRPPSSTIVHAEVWPSAWTSSAVTSEVKDRGQVRAVVEQLDAAARSGRLAPSFGEPPGLDDAERAAAVDEEGWILGPPSPR